LHNGREIICLEVHVLVVIR